MCVLLQTWLGSRLFEQWSKIVSISFANFTNSKGARHKDSHNMNKQEQSRRKAINILNSQVRAIHKLARHNTNNIQILNDRARRKLIKHCEIQTNWISVTRLQTNNR